jgi:hypothetical protein
VYLTALRKRTLFALLLVTPAGFLFKIYSGPVARWFNDYGAGLLYEVFWILLVFFFFPRKELANKIALWVFSITCALEVMQLWNPPILEAIRSTFLGRALIGTSFSWLDFPHYAAGCLAGWMLIKMMARKSD